MALADKALQRMDEADDLSESYGAIQQGLLGLAELISALSFDEQQMAAGGFAASFAIPLMDGARWQATAVIDSAAAPAPAA